MSGWRIIAGGHSRATSSPPQLQQPFTANTSICTTFVNIRIRRSFHHHHRHRHRHHHLPLLPSSSLLIPPPSLSLHLTLRAYAAADLPAPSATAQPRHHLPLLPTIHAKSDGDRGAMAGQSATKPGGRSKDRDRACRFQRQLLPGCHLQPAARPGHDSVSGGRGREGESTQGWDFVSVLIDVTSESIGGLWGGMAGTTSSSLEATSVISARLPNQATFIRTGISLARVAQAPPSRFGVSLVSIQGVAGVTHTHTLRF